MLQVSNRVLRLTGVPSRKHGVDIVFQICPMCACFNCESVGHPVHILAAVTVDLLEGCLLLLLVVAAVVQMLLGHLEGARHLCPVEVQCYSQS